MRLHHRHLPLAVCSSVVLSLVLSGGGGVATASVASASANPAVPLCGVADMSSVTTPLQAPPADPVHVGPGGFTVSYLTVANGELHVLDAGTATVRRFTPDGAPLGSLTAPFRLSAPNMVVDPDGSLYLSQYPATLVKLAPSGHILWSRAGAAQEIDGLFGTGSGSGFRVGVVGRGEAGSALFDAAGTATGRSEITGSSFSAGPDGGVVATDGRYVRRYDPAGRLLAAFGDARTTNDPSPTGGPFHFYQQGGAVTLPDGTTYVTDATRGIEAATSEGFFRGKVPDEMLGSLTERSALAVSGDRLYFAAGGRFNANQHVSWISLADLAALVDQPKAPHHVLGYGAGLATNATGNYFAAGRLPAVTASFDPWWVRHAPGLRLSYTVRDRAQVLAAAVPAATEVALPTTASGLAGFALSLPPARPGYYEVDARLVAVDGSVVGATCVTYTVGAPGHRLDFASLPAGPDFGGPTPARGVALADVLGTGDFRGAVDLAQLLPDPGGPMRFEAYDGPFADAAREAAARGVAFHVQVGTGTPVDKALVRNGTWGARVQELVTHFKGTVHVWEAWNEPNVTFGSADAYVNQVLRPFSHAVRAADSTATVIGGSVVGMDVDYYDAIGRAGGFSLMDVVAIHPYTGHNRSWEEQGTPASIERLRTVLASHGAGSKPIWNTESAWWADGPGNYLPQADKAARAMLWMRALDVERWGYFMIEGGYGDYGLSYSLIQSASQPDDFVKPAALATMTVAGATGGRPFTSMVDTGIPHAYVASFGARPGAGDSVLAAWTDDLPVDATVVADGGTDPVRVTATDVLGATTVFTLTPGQPAPLALSGSPLYLSAPATAKVRIAAPEAFGDNLAVGATASASSALVGNPAASAVDGVSDALERGDLPGLPAWASAPGDAAPSLTMRLALPTQLDRVVVSTHSIGSIVPGLRSYDVSVQGLDGAWTSVAVLQDRFFARRQLVSFAPRLVTAVRVDVRSVNYSGMAGGLQPWYWPTDAASVADASAPWHGPAVIYEVEAYAPTTVVDPIDPVDPVDPVDPITPIVVQPDPGVEGTFHPLPPARMLDTRSGNGAPRAKVGSGATMDLQVTGRGGVPSEGVSAVVMNVTVTEPSAGGHLTAWPTGSSLPLASNLNFVAGQTVPNLVVAKVGAGGKVSLRNNFGQTHVIADVVGWYGAEGATTGSRYNALSPGRILDTRSGYGAPAATLGSGATMDLQVTGRAGVPTTGVSAVVMNVTVTEPTAASHLTAWPTGSSLPLASNLNFVAGQTVPNLVVAKVGAGGKVSLRNNSGQTHVIADVVGWYGADGGATGARYNPLSPERILDTRSGNGAPSATLGSGATMDLQVTGRGGVPTTGVSAVVMNVTVTEPTAASHLTAWPTGSSLPLASNLNFVAGQTVPNLVVAKVGAGGKVSLRNNSGQTHVIADVVGWYGSS